MPISECENCGGNLQWYWEEAFAKFGFGDGDGQVETWQVVDALQEAGYEAKAEDWGLHNCVITSIVKDGKELIPSEGITYGYESPRGYLPKDVIALLDEALPSEGEPGFLF